ncbi:MAG: thiamine diphosphokinase [Chlorobiaceae bacterium]|nr:thiamine diphosphokinase [Chlorobiaceae bacterium]MBA4310601.1 thiamine diphosphokinase [Chlorobiaceae bacterium]
MKKSILIANGAAPKKSEIEYLLRKNFTEIICADGGFNAAVKLGYSPNFVIGDFDSIDKTKIKLYEEKTKFIKIKRQNDTDVEKCIKFLIKKKYSEIVLLGALGLRLDHSISNLGIVLKFFSQIKISIIGSNSYLVPYSNNVILKTKANETISIYAFDYKTKITSKGLLYELKNDILPFGKRDSTSNVAIGDSIELKIKNGVVFVVRDFNKIKKYDLI